MKQLSRNIVKNLLVAATMGLAAFATWAVTDLHAPTIEVAAAAPQHG